MDRTTSSSECLTALMRRLVKSAREVDSNAEGGGGGLEEELKAARRAMFGKG
jgi:hypothetical protein